MIGDLGAPEKSEEEGDSAYGDLVFWNWTCSYCFPVPKMYKFSQTLSKTVSKKHEFEQIFVSFNPLSSNAIAELNALFLLPYSSAGISNPSRQ